MKYLVMWCLALMGIMALDGCAVGFVEPAVVYRQPLPLYHGEFRHHPPPMRYHHMY